MSGPLVSLYDRLPPRGQDLLLSAYGLKINLERYGPKFRRRYEEFLENGDFPEELRWENVVRAPSAAVDTAPEGE